MSELICPHCHNRVPRGARVCRGCQAELHYGAHPALYAIAVIIGFYLMHKAGAAASHLPDIVKLGVLVITGGGLCYLINRAFRNRVIFKRRYRT